MEDKEFVELRNKFLIAVVVALLFMIPMIIFFKRNMTEAESSLIKDIDNKKNMIVLITDNKHNSYKDIINRVTIKKKIINIDKDNDYHEVLEKLEIVERDIVVPTVIYIKKGRYYAKLTDIQKKDNLIEFLSSYEVIE